MVLRLTARIMTILWSAPLAMTTLFQATAMTLFLTIRVAILLKVEMVTTPSIRGQIMTWSLPAKVEIQSSQEMGMTLSLEALALMRYWAKMGMTSFLVALE